MEWEHVFFESTALIGLQLILLHWNSTSFMESSCYLVDFHLYTVCVPFLFQSTFITCFIKLPTFMPETAVSCAWLKIQISSKHVFFPAAFLMDSFWSGTRSPVGQVMKAGVFCFCRSLFGNSTGRSCKSWSVGDQLQALMLLGNHRNFPWEFPRKDPCESTVRRGFEWCVYLYVKKKQLGKELGLVG